MRYFAILAAVFLTTTISATAEPLAEKTITVNGFASIDVKPDHATVSIGVDTTDKITTKAVAANNALMSAVIAAIEAQGVPEKKIQTSRFSIDAQHPNQEKGYGYDYTVTTGYTVSNSVVIELDDVSKVPQIIDAAVRAGANTSNWVSYEAKNKQALDDKVLADAMKDARHTAEVMAAAEGARLGKMISAANSASFGAPFGGGMYMAQSKAKEAPPSFMSGQTSVSASVTVVFSLE